MTFEGTYLVQKGKNMVNLKDRAALDEWIARCRDEMKDDDEVELEETQAELNRLLALRESMGFK